MAERKAILISNPRTGRYGTRRQPQLDGLCEYLRKHDVAIELVRTTGPGDATRIAAQAAGDGFNEVIVSGGDGTINEVLQGMIGTNARLGILPTGTGDRKSTRLNSSHITISYAVFCLKKKKKQNVK